MVRVRAGQALHCESSTDEASKLPSKTSMFATIQYYYFNCIVNEEKNFILRDVVIIIILNFFYFLGTILSFGFSPSGTLFVAEETSKKNRFIRRVLPSGWSEHFAGSSLEDCGCTTIQDCSCPQDKVLFTTYVFFILK